MTDKYKKTWIVTICLIAAFAIADGILALLDIPTISQMAYHRAQEDPWIIWGAIAFNTWLFVHLFWRWKNLWKYVRENWL